MNTYVDICLIKGASCVWRNGVLMTCFILCFFQEMIIKADEKGNMKEKVDAMQKKYDVSGWGNLTIALCVCVCIECI